MKSNKQTWLRLTLVLLGVLIVGAAVSNTFDGQIGQDHNDNSTELQSSWGYDSGTIEITHLDNWTDFVNDYDWCYIEDGDHYVIENCTLDNGHIKITFTNMSFIIRNCIISDLDNTGISIENCGNFTLRNNTVYNSKNGIKVSSLSSILNKIEIINNSLLGISSYALYFLGSQDYPINGSSIVNNTIENGKNGMYLHYCPNITVNNNYIKNMTIQLGIALMECPNALVTNNSLFGDLSILLWDYIGSGWIHSINIENKSNTVDNDPILVFKNRLSLQLTDLTYAGQVILINCSGSLIDNIKIPILGCHSDNVIVKNSQIKDEYVDIFFQYCSNISIVNNSLVDSRNGLFLEHCNDSIVYGNNFHNLGDYGVKLEYTNYTEVYDNIFGNNYYAILLFSSLNNTITNNSIYNSSFMGIYVVWESNGNTFYLNYFVNNSKHVQASGIYNQWDNGSIGNYWDDYNGTDTSPIPDGIGEDPYNISGPAEGKDYFPLWDVLPPTVSIEYPINTTYITSNQDINISAIEITDWKLEPVAAIDTVLAELDNSKNITLTQITDNLWSNLSYEFTEGPHTLQIYANDTFGNMNATETISFTIDTNAPVWTPEPDNITINVDEPLSRDFDATDLQPIIYSVDDTGNFTMNDSTGELQNATDLSHGFYEITLNASDGTYHNLSTITVTIRETSKPTWDQQPQNQTIELGDPFSYNVNATDPHSYIADYGVNDTIFTMSSEGVLSNASLEFGIYWLEIWAEDPYGNNRTAIIKVNVTDSTAPLWAPAPDNITIEEGMPLNTSLSATDLRAISFSVSDTDNFTIAGTYLQNATILSTLTYPITLNVSDGLNHNLIEINVTVLPGAPPQWNITIENQTLNYGESLSYAIGATDVSELDAFWVNSTLFAFDEQGTLTNITALDAGMYWLEISVNDTLGHSTTETFKITVSEPVGPSDGGGQPPDPMMIIVIAGVVGGIGTAGAVGGAVLYRKRKANADKEPSQTKQSGEKKALSSGPTEDATDGNDEGYAYQPYQDD